MDREISRRRFVRTAAWGTGGLLLFADPRLGATARAVAPASDVAFTQGVASGEPGQRGITLWTHLDGLDRASRVQVEIAADPGFGSVLLSTEALADPAAGGSARVRIENGPLQPGGQYYYRFATGGIDSPVGRFRTARPADSAEPVTIAVFSCQEYIAGFYEAHRDLAALEDVDLALCLGDYIYEQSYASTLSLTGPVRTDTSAPTGETETLAEYRAKYALHHTDPDLLAMRARMPLLAMWDDHEVEDNYAGTLPGGAAKHRRLPFLERRANGYQANYEAMPRIRSAADRDRTYGSFRLGGAELFLLDTRQFRSNQPCAPDDSAIALGCLPSEYNRGWRTQLGPQQKTWLKAGLKASQAPWKLIGNQVMMMSLDASPGFPVNTDSWDGYGAERRELIDYLGREGIEDVSFLTGDIHTFFAGAVTRTGRGVNSIAGAAGPARATEFVCGSITSPGIADRLGNDERTRRAAAAAIDPLVLGANRHMAFSNQAYKGYGLVTVTPEELRVTYRAVRDWRRQSSEVFDLVRFRVPRGEALVERTYSAYPLAPRSSMPLPSSMFPRGLTVGTGT